MSSKTQFDFYQPPSYRSCWFEESSLDSELALINNKLINIADLAVLEKICTNLKLIQGNITELHFHISSEVSSTQVLHHLNKYFSESAMTENHFREFTIMLEIIMMEAYLTTQSTIKNLRHISKDEANQAYFA